MASCSLTIYNSKTQSVSLQLRSKDTRKQNELRTDGGRKVGQTFMWILWIEKFFSSAAKVSCSLLNLFVVCNSSVVIYVLYICVLDPNLQSATGLGLDAQEACLVSTTLYISSPPPVIHITILYYRMPRKPGSCAGPPVHPALQK